MFHHEARADTYADRVQEVVFRQPCLRKVGLNPLLLSRPKFTQNVLLTRAHQAVRSSTKHHRLQPHSRQTASNGPPAATAEVEAMLSNHHHHHHSILHATTISGNANPSLNPPSPPPSPHPAHLGIASDHAPSRSTPASSPSPRTSPARPLPSSTMSTPTNSPASSPNP